MYRKSQILGTVYVSSEKEISSQNVPTCVQRTFRLYPPCAFCMRIVGHTDL